MNSFKGLGEARFVIQVTCDYFSSLQYCMVRMNQVMAIARVEWDSRTCDLRFFAFSLSGFRVIALTCHSEL